MTHPAAAIDPSRSPAAEPRTLVDNLSFEVKEGDIVTAGQCRPLSKTVRFNLLKVEKNQIFGSSRKQFRLF